MSSSGPDPEKGVATEQVSSVNGQDKTEALLLGHKGKQEDEPISHPLTTLFADARGFRLTR